MYKLATLSTILIIGLSCSSTTKHTQSPDITAYTHSHHKASTTSPYYNPNNMHNTISTISTISLTHSETPNIPITTITYIGNFQHITQTNLKKPKSKVIKYYTWNNSIIILLGGDIQTNPGPPLYILHNLPKLHYYTHSKNIYEQHIPLKYLTLSPPLTILITHISTIRYTTHTYLKHPKTKVIHYYMWNNSIIILLGGDIHTNPGPLLYKVANLLRRYIQRHKQCFMTNTTMLKNHYKYLEEKSKHYLNKQSNSQLYTIIISHSLKHHNTISHTFKHTNKLYTPPNSTPLHTNQYKPITQKSNQKSQLNITIQHHTQLHLLILQCGDIHPNPGPMPDLLKTHPPDHKRRQTTYFLPSTIKFHPEYQHLAETFKPLFQNTHPLHTQIIHSLPYLYNHIQQYNHHPPPRVIYAIVVTISPSTLTCNTLLQHQPIQEWTSQLLERMSRLQNPPERHIDTPHPYT